MNSIPQVKTKAEPKSLYEQGYRAYVADGSLIVIKPDAQRNRYMVDLYNATCTCYAGERGIVCKHLVHIADLVHASEENLWNRKKRRQAVALASHWADYQFAMQQKAGVK